MPIQHLLLPTNLSSNSGNAVAYGIKLANVLQVRKITILHTYAANNAIANQPVISAGIPEMLQDEQNELDNLKLNVQSQVGTDVTVTTYLAEGKLVHVAYDLISNKGVDLIVMGISTKTKLEQNLIGSNAINVIRKTNCPVIVVPDNASWVSHPNIAVAIDITHDTNRIPIEKVKNVFKQMDGSKLYLVNIEDEDDHSTHIQNPNIEKINYTFSDWNTKLEILSSPNKAKAIENYCTDRSIHLLVLFERKYGILDTIFRKSLIRQIAYQASTPILVIAELPEI